MGLKHKRGQQRREGPREFGVMGGGSVGAMLPERRGIGRLPRSRQFPGGRRWREEGGSLRSRRGTGAVGGRGDLVGG